jgi:serine/threonine-protein kinase
MKRSGPLYTLLGGLLLALFMLSLNATTGSGNSSYGGDSPGAASPAPTESATEKPSKKPSEKPSESPSESPSKKPPGKAEYAGRTADDAAAVSVSVRDDKAIAYYCNGRDAEAWLKGKVEDDGSMHLTGKHGAKLDGTLAGNAVRGKVEIDKRPRDFTAARAKKPSGLYRATTEVRGAEIDGGWIVLPDGRQVGILKEDGKPQKAPRLDPETGAVPFDGGELTARPVVP